MDLQRTPLHRLHATLGAKMVAFAGHEMPLHYPMGIIREHLHVRSKAGLFDASHMGQAILTGPDHRTTAEALERLVPGDIAGLGNGHVRYTLLLDDAGGIIDDIMVMRPDQPAGEGSLHLVVNASRTAADYAHIGSRLPPAVALQPLARHALIALQGPAAEEALARCFALRTKDLWFLETKSLTLAGTGCRISRSGYTGEDGFEISIPADQVEETARSLLADESVMPIGLGARDTLRLEAGLPLYGHDIDATTSPVEAGLAWTIPARRRSEANFAGARRILDELARGVRRRRIGLRPDGKVIVREGTRVIGPGGRDIGIVTSGGFGPSIGGPIAMGYVAAEFAIENQPVHFVVRGNSVPGRVTALPFVPHRFRRRANQS